MGFNTILDIMGSTLIGGMLLMILFRLNDAAVENNYMYGGELVVQQNLVAVVELLEFDFRKIGYCADWEKLSNPLLYIIAADSNYIKFRTDLDSDGNVDSLTYYTGSTS
jgi:type II secretory pathway component PulJ